MTIPTTYRFTRYLAAKKSVDDRALNRHVWQRLTQAMSQAASDGPVQVLEIGAGIGTMVERLVEWGLLRQAAYTAIDVDPETIAESHQRLPVWMVGHGFDVREESLTRQCFRRNEQEIVVETEIIDLQSFIARTQGRRAWDLLIAHAVLDLLHIPSMLPSVLSLLRPGGLFYFSIAFDGATILQPSIDPVLDAQIEALYHQTMDQRRIAGQPAGDSRTGRHLFAQLQAAGAEILAAGSSDWVIFAGPHGYPDDEAYFLHFIIHTIGTALRGHSRIDPDNLARWIAQRHAQIEQGSLVYIAHQLDFLGRVPKSSDSLSLPTSSPLVG
jgi:SAM-dependent methyltransferase